MTAPNMDEALATLNRATGGHHGPNGNGPKAATGARVEPTWPALDRAALHGLAGKVVRAIEPHTEGDPAAVLLNFLAMFGCAAGRGAWTPVGAVRHHANLFVVMVGTTSKGRKGTAHAEPERLLRIADPTWAANRVMGGLASGEGLIHQVRDATEKPDKSDPEVMIVVDAGEPDKRLLVVEEEFSATAKVGGRDGNTLTEVIRKAWDGKTLRVMTRNSPIRATEPHVAILGHITKDELLRVLDSTETVNGYANRFLFACVRRSKHLPHGGDLGEAEVNALARKVAAALAEAKVRGELRRDAEANALWEAMYPELTADRPGLLGGVTARAEAQTLRLSLSYALLDGAGAIRADHLLAALAVWQFCEASAAYIFGDATGDDVADRVLAALRNGGAMAQSELGDLFGRHVKSARLARGLEVLLAAGKVRTWREETLGRPRTLWEAAP